MVKYFRSDNQIVGYILNMMNSHPHWNLKVYHVILFNLNIFLYFYIRVLLFLEVYISWTIKAQKTEETFMCNYTTFAWNKRLNAKKK